MCSFASSIVIRPAGLRPAAIAVSAKSFTKWMLSGSLRRSFSHSTRASANFCFFTSPAIFIFGKKACAAASGLTATLPLCFSR